MRASDFSRRPLVFFITVSAILLATDQLSKALALRHLPEGRSVGVLGELLCFTLTTNTGSAFSLLQHRQGLLIGLSLGLCLAIFAFVALYKNLRSAHLLPLALIWGGSLGNLLDRFRHGAVIDFIDLQVWPVFNIADSAITVGYLILVGQVMRRESRVES